MFQELLTFSDESPNMSKCEIAGIKSQNSSLWYENNDLTRESLKINQISFFYNVGIQNESNFSTAISDIKSFKTMDNVKTQG